MDGRVFRCPCYSLVRDCPASVYKHMRTKWHARCVRGGFGHIPPGERDAWAERVCLWLEANERRLPRDGGAVGRSVREVFDALVRRE
jgi:hypothetical protein